MNDYALTQVFRKNETALQLPRKSCPKEENKMNHIELNPYIRSVTLYERVGRTEECVAYDCRVIYMVSGELTATVGGEKLGHLAPGNLLYIPAGTPYKLKSKYLRAVVVTFDHLCEAGCPENVIPPSQSDLVCEEKLRKCGIEQPFDKWIKLDDFESERDTFLRMNNVFTSAEGNFRAQISAMFKLILLKIADNVEEGALPAVMVEALDAYIRENCSDEISNTELGAIFGYHPFYISTLLKERRGITLRQYVIAYRLKYAKRMLESTDKSMADIADGCGFTDASYFAKIFKSTFGMTPKEYRNKFKEEFI